MQPSKLRKYLASTLSVVYLSTNCVLAHSAEVNFWSERRRSVKESQPTQLASLPLPSAAVTLERFYPGSTFSPIKMDPPRRMTELPIQYGSIRKVLEPKSPSSKNQTIIHIQDIHQNSEAQNNIAKTIQELINNQQVDLIALEGAFAPIDLTTFRSFPHHDTIRKVADYLLKENKISGPIHTAFVSPSKIPPIVGVDDETHYQANVDAYKRSAPLMNSSKQELEAQKRKLAEQKVKTFNPDLAAFDQHVEAYRMGSTTMGEHLRFLSTTRADSSPTVQTFLEALNLESSLNFAQVEAERARLLSKLLTRLNKDQTSALINQSMVYRLGKIRNADFYQYLRDLCDHNGIPLAQFPAMSDYLKYVYLSDSIDAEKLFEEIKRMEEGGYASRIKAVEEQRLIKESKRLYLVGKLLDFSLTREEWGEYSNQAPSPFVGEGWGEGSLTAFESFYKEAQTRDNKMAGNLLRALTRPPSGADLSQEGEVNKVTVLVTGGFHSAGIDQKLADAGFTVISFVPKITKVDTENGSAYLSVFTQEKTPLEKLFEGQKLFLSNDPWSPYVQRLLAPTAYGLVQEYQITGDIPTPDEQQTFDRQSGTTLPIRFEAHDGKPGETEGEIIVSGNPYVANASFDSQGKLESVSVSPSDGFSFTGLLQTAWVNKLFQRFGRNPLSFWNEVVIGPAIERVVYVVPGYFLMAFFVAFGWVGSGMVSLVIYHFVSSALFAWHHENATKRDFFLKFGAGFVLAGLASLPLYLGLVDLTSSSSYVTSLMEESALPFGLAYAAHLLVDGIHHFQRSSARRVTKQERRRSAPSAAPSGSWWIGLAASLAMTTLVAMNIDRGLIDPFGGAFQQQSAVSAPQITIAKKKSAELAQSINEFKLQGDTDTSLEAVVVQYGFDNIGDNLSENYLRALRPNVRVVVIVPDKKTADEIWSRMAQMNMKDLKKRVRFVEIPYDEMPGKEPKPIFTQWGRDPYLVFNSKTGTYAILSFGANLKNPERYIDAAVANHLSGADVGLPIKLISAPPLSTWFAQGGATPSDDEYVYIDDKEIKEHRYKKDVAVYSREQVLERLKQAFGKKLIMTHGTDAHSDRYLMPVGETAFGKRTVMLADPIAALHTIANMTNDERAEALIQAVKLYPPRLQGLEKFMDDYRAFLFSVTPESIEELRKSDYVRSLDETERILTREYGVKVVRLPTLSKNEIKPIFSSPLGFYYTNIVQDVSANDRGGTTGREMFIYSYGIERLDNQVLEIYRSLRCFDKIHVIPNIADGMLSGGIRCRSQVLGRPVEPKKDLKGIQKNGATRKRIGAAVTAVGACVFLAGGDIVIPLIIFGVVAGLVGLAIWVVRFFRRSTQQELNDWLQNPPIIDQSTRAETYARALRLMLPKSMQSRVEMESADWTRIFGPQGIPPTQEEVARKLVTFFSPSEAVRVARTMFRYSADEDAAARLPIEAKSVEAPLPPHPSDPKRDLVYFVLSFHADAGDVEGWAPFIPKIIQDAKNGGAEKIYLGKENVFSMQNMETYLGFYHVLGNQGKEAEIIRKYEITSEEQAAFRKLVELYRDLRLTGVPIQSVKDPNVAQWHRLAEFIESPTGAIALGVVAKFTAKHFLSNEVPPEYLILNPDLKEFIQRMEKVERDNNLIPIDEIQSPYIIQHFLLAEINTGFEVSCWMHREAEKARAYAQIAYPHLIKAMHARGVATHVQTFLVKGEKEAAKEKAQNSVDHTLWEFAQLWEEANQNVLSYGDPAKRGFIIFRGRGHEFEAHQIGETHRVLAYMQHGDVTEMPLNRLIQNGIQEPDQTLDSGLLARAAANQHVRALVQYAFYRHLEPSNASVLQQGSSAEIVHRVRKALPADEIINAICFRIIEGRNLDKLGTQVRPPLTYEEAVDFISKTSRASENWDDRRVASEKMQKWLSDHNHWIYNDLIKDPWAVQIRIGRAPYFRHDIFPKETEAPASLAHHIIFIIATGWCQIVMRMSKEETRLALNTLAEKPLVKAVGMVWAAVEIFLMGYVIFSPGLDWDRRLFWAVTFLVVDMGTGFWANYLRGSPLKESFRRQIFWLHPGILYLLLATHIPILHDWLQLSPALSIIVSSMVATIFVGTGAYHWRRDWRAIGIGSQMSELDPLVTFLVPVLACFTAEILLAMGWNMGHLPHSAAVTVVSIFGLYYTGRLAGIGFLKLLSWWVSAGFVTNPPPFSLITPIARMASSKGSGEDIFFLSSTGGEQRINWAIQQTFRFLSHRTQWILYYLFLFSLRERSRRQNNQDSPAVFNHGSNVTQMYMDHNRVLVAGPQETSLWWVPTRTKRKVRTARPTEEIVDLHISRLRNGVNEEQIGAALTVTDKNYVIEHDLITGRRAIRYHQTEKMLDACPSYNLPRLFPGAFALTPHQISDEKLRVKISQDKPAFRAFWVSSDRRWLATLNVKGEIEIWSASELNQEEPKHRFTPESPFTVTPELLSFEVNRRSIVAAANKNEVRVFVPNSETRCFSHQAKVSALALSPSGTHLITSDGKTIYVWNPYNGNLLESFDTTSSVVKLAFSQDNAHIMAATEDGKVLVWSRESKEEEAAALPHGWTHHQRRDNDQPPLPPEILQQIDDEPHTWHSTMLQEAGGAEGVGIHPEMLLWAKRGWWAAKKPRPGRLHELRGHSGTDWATLIYPGFEARPIPPETPVRAMFAGKIIAKYEDEMQMTYVVATGHRDHRGREMIQMYMHVKPDAKHTYEIGDSVERGAILGRIGYSRNLASPVAPHLHMSIGMMDPDQFHLLNRPDMSNAILDDLILIGLIELFDPLDLFEPEDLDQFHDYKFEGLQNILIILKDRPDLKGTTKERKIDRVRQMIGVQYPGVDLLGAKSVKGYGPILDDEKQRAGIHVIVTNDSNLENELKKQYQGQLDHIAFVRYETLGLDLNYHEFDLDTEGSELLEDLKMIQRAGPLYNASLDQIIEERDLQENLTKNGVHTLRDLISMIDKREVLRDDESTDKEGDLRFDTFHWDVLDSLAHKLPEAIRYFSLRPKSDLRETGSLPLPPAITLEKVIRATYDRQIQLANIAINRPEAIARLYQPAVRLLPDQVCSKTILALIPTDRRHLVERKLNGIDNMGGLIQLIQDDRARFAAIFPDQKNQQAVRLAVLQLAPWLYPYQKRVVEQLASAGEVEKLEIMCASSRISAPRRLRENRPPYPGIVIAPEVLKQKPNWSELFGNNNPIHLEIDFQGGDDLLDFASEAVGENFIGIANDPVVMGRLAGLVEARGLHNVFLILGNARDLIGNIFPDNSLSEINIYYPKAQDLRSLTADTRLFHTHLLGEDEVITLNDFHFVLANKLNVWGNIYIRTSVDKIWDFRTYGRQIFTIFLGLTNLRVSISRAEAAHKVVSEPSYLPDTRGTWLVNDITVTKLGHPVTYANPSSRPAVLVTGEASHDMGQKPPPLSSTLAVIWEFFYRLKHGQDLQGKTIREMRESILADLAPWESHILGTIASLWVIAGGIMNKTSLLFYFLPLALGLVWAALHLTGVYVKDASGNIEIISIMSKSAAERRAVIRHALLLGLGAIFWLSIFMGVIYGLNHLDFLMPVRHSPTRYEPAMMNEYFDRLKYFSSLASWFAGSILISLLPAGFHRWRNVSRFDLPVSKPAWAGLTPFWDEIFPNEETKKEKNRYMAPIEIFLMLISVVLFCHFTAHWVSDFNQYQYFILYSGVLLIIPLLGGVLYLVTGSYLQAGNSGQTSLRRGRGISVWRHAFLQGLIGFGAVWGWLVFSNHIENTMPPVNFILNELEFLPIFSFATVAGLLAAFVHYWLKEKLLKGNGSVERPQLMKSSLVGVLIFASYLLMAHRTYFSSPAPVLGWQHGVALALLIGVPAFYFYRLIKKVGFKKIKFLILDLMVLVFISALLYLLPDYTQFESIISYGFWTKDPDLVQSTFLVRSALNYDAFYILSVFAGLSFIAFFNSRFSALKHKKFFAVAICMLLPGCVSEIGGQAMVVVFGLILCAVGASAFMAENVQGPSAKNPDRVPYDIMRFERDWSQISAQIGLDIYAQAAVYNVLTHGKNLVHQQIDLIKLLWPVPNVTGDQKVALAALFSLPRGYFDPSQVPPGDTEERRWQLAYTPQRADFSVDKAVPAIDEMIRRENLPLDLYTPSPERPFPPNDPQSNRYYQFLSLHEIRSHATQFLRPFRESVLDARQRGVENFVVWKELVPNVAIVRENLQDLATNGDRSFFHKELELNGIAKNDIRRLQSFAEVFVQAHSRTLRDVLNVLRQGDPEAMNVYCEYWMRWVRSYTTGGSYNQAIREIQSNTGMGFATEIATPEVLRLLLLNYTLLTPLSLANDYGYDELNSETVLESHQVLEKLNRERAITYWNQMSRLNVAAVYSFKGVFHIFEPKVVDSRITPPQSVTTFAQDPADVMQPAERLEINRLIGRKTPDEEAMFEQSLLSTLLLVAIKTMVQCDSHSAFVFCARLLDARDLLTGSRLPDKQALTRVDVKRFHERTAASFKRLAPEWAKTNPLDWPYQAGKQLGTLVTREQHNMVLILIDFLRETKALWTDQADQLFAKQLPPLPTRIVRDFDLEGLVRSVEATNDSQKSPPPVASLAYNFSFIKAWWEGGKKLSKADAERIAQDPRVQKRGMTSAKTEIAVMALALLCPCGYRGLWLGMAIGFLIVDMGAGFWANKIRGGPRGFRFWLHPSFSYVFLVAIRILFLHDSFSFKSSIVIFCALIIVFAVTAAYHLWRDARLIWTKNLPNKPDAPLPPRAADPQRDFVYFLLSYHDAKSTAEEEFGPLWNVIKSDAQEGGASGYYNLIERVPYWNNLDHTVGIYFRLARDHREPEIAQRYHVTSEEREAFIRLGAIWTQLRTTQAYPWNSDSPIEESLWENLARFLASKTGLCALEAFGKFHNQDFMQREGTPEELAHFPQWSTFSRSMSQFGEARGMVTLPEIATGRILQETFLQIIDMQFQQGATRRGNTEEVEKFLISMVKHLTEGTRCRAAATHVQVFLTKGDDVEAQRKAEENPSDPGLWSQAEIWKNFHEQVLSQGDPSRRAVIVSRGRAHEFESENLGLTHRVLAFVQRGGADELAIQRIVTNSIRHPELAIDPLLSAYALLWARLDILLQDAVLQEENRLHPEHFEGKNPREASQHLVKILPREEIIDAFIARLVYGKNLARTPKRRHNPLTREEALDLTTRALQSRETDKAVESVLDWLEDHGRWDTYSALYGETSEILKNLGPAPYYRIDYVPTLVHDSAQAKNAPASLGFNFSIINARLRAFWNRTKFTKTDAEKIAQDPRVKKRGMTSAKIEIIAMALALFWPGDYRGLRLGMAIGFLIIDMGAGFWANYLRGSPMRRIDWLHPGILYVLLAATHFPFVHEYYLQYLTPALFSAVYWTLLIVIFAGTGAYHLWRDWQTIGKGDLDDLMDEIEQRFFDSRSFDNLASQIVSQLNQHPVWMNTGNASPTLDFKNLSLVIEAPGFLSPKILEVLQNRRLEGESVDILWYQLASTVLYSQFNDLGTHGPDVLNPKRMAQITAEAVCLLHLSALIISLQADLANKNHDPAKANRARKLLSRLDRLLHKSGRMPITPSLAEAWVWISSPAVYDDDWTPGEGGFWLQETRRRVEAAHANSTGEPPFEKQLTAMTRAVQEWPETLRDSERIVETLAMLYHLDEQIFILVRRKMTGALNNASYQKLLETVGKANSYDFQALAEHLPFILELAERGSGEEAQRAQEVIGLLLLVMPEVFLGNTDERDLLLREVSRWKQDETLTFDKNGCSNGVGALSMFFCSALTNMAEIPLIKTHPIAVQRGLEALERHQPLSHFPTHELFTHTFVNKMTAARHLGVGSGVIRLRDGLLRNAAWKKWWEGESPSPLVSAMRNYRGSQSQRLISLLGKYESTARFVPAFNSDEAQAAHARHEELSLLYWELRQLSSKNKPMERTNDFYAYKLNSHENYNSDLHVPLETISLVPGKTSRGEFVRVQAGEFVLMSLDKNNERALCSEPHFECTSFSMRVFDREGREWIGHAHLKPADHDPLGSPGQTYEEIKKILRFLKSNGFEKVELVVGVNEKYWQGLPGSKDAFENAIRADSKEMTLDLNALSFLTRGNPTASDAAYTLVLPEGVAIRQYEGVEPKIRFIAWEQPVAPGHNSHFGKAWWNGRWNARFPAFVLAIAASLLVYCGVNRIIDLTRLVPYQSESLVEEKLTVQIDNRQEDKRSIQLDQNLKTVPSLEEGKAETVPAESREVVHDAPNPIQVDPQAGETRIIVTKQWRGSLNIADIKRIGVELSDEQADSGKKIECYFVFRAPDLHDETFYIDTELGELVWGDKIGGGGSPANPDLPIVRQKVDREKSVFWISVERWISEHNENNQVLIIGIKGAPETTIHLSKNEKLPDDASVLTLPDKENEDAIRKLQAAFNADINNKVSREPLLENADQQLALANKIKNPARQVRLLAEITVAMDLIGEGDQCKALIARVKELLPKADPSDTNGITKSLDSIGRWRRHVLPLGEKDTPPEGGEDILMQGSIDRYRRGLERSTYVQYVNGLKFPEKGHLRIAILPTSTEEYYVRLLEKVNSPNQQGNYYQHFQYGKDSVQIVEIEVGPGTYVGTKVLSQISFHYGGEAWQRPLELNQKVRSEKAPGVTIQSIYFYPEKSKRENNNQNGKMRSTRQTKTVALLRNAESKSISNQELAKGLLVLWGHPSSQHLSSLNGRLIAELQDRLQQPNQDELPDILPLLGYLMETKQLAVELEQFESNQSDVEVGHSRFELFFSGEKITRQELAEQIHDLLAKNAAGQVIFPVIDRRHARITDNDIVILKQQFRDLPVVFVSQGDLTEESLKEHAIEKFGRDQIGDLSEINVFVSMWRGASQIKGDLLTGLETLRHHGLRVNAYIYVDGLGYSQILVPITFTDLSNFAQLQRIYRRQA